MLSIAEARRLYDGEDAVHDFDHVLRVLKLAERIARSENADPDIVRAAVLLHDVGRHQAEAAGVDHAMAAARRAREILVGNPSRKVERIVEAIAAHRFRTEPKPSTLEAQVLYDADKLDAIGAIGVARAFAYAGVHGQHLWAPVESVDLERWQAEGDDTDIHTPVHEFVVKLSRIKDRLYTATGRALAEARHAYMVSFFERLEQEVSGAV